MQKSKLRLRREKMSSDEIITELTEIVLTQMKEIKRLEERIKHIKQYIEVYEEYIEKENCNGDYGTSGTFGKE